MATGFLGGFLIGLASQDLQSANCHEKGVCVLCVLNRSLARFNDIELTIVWLKKCFSNRLQLDEACFIRSRSGHFYNLHLSQIYLIHSVHFNWKLQDKPSINESLACDRPSRIHAELAFLLLAFCKLVVIALHPAKSYALSTCNFASSNTVLLHFSHFLLHIVAG